LSSQKVAHCRSDFRNPTAGRVRSRLIYEHGKLTFLVDTYDQNEYHECFSVSNIQIQKGSFIGFTGATGKNKK
jgi:hypothetical protein